MLFRRAVLDGIRAGTVTLAFRRWETPAARAGGVQKTAVGLVRIRSIAAVDEGSITEEDARRAGAPSRDALLAELSRRRGPIWRMEIEHAGEDPRLALRERDEMDAAELAALRTRLARLDAASAAGPWTRDVLRLVAANPGVRAGDLAPQVRMEREAFKLQVRKLKNLGLTISLGTGYRISPRGEALLAADESAPAR